MENTNLRMAYECELERSKREIAVQTFVSDRQMLKSCLSKSLEFTSRHAPKIYVKAAGRTKKSTPMLSSALRREIRKISYRYGSMIESEAVINESEIVNNCFEEVMGLMNKMTSRGMYLSNEQLCGHAKSLIIETMSHYRHN